MVVADNGTGVVLIFGIFHEIQRTDLTAWNSPHHADQRRQFIATLRQLVAEFSVKFIGDEVGNHHSCVKDIADGGRIYFDVEMPTAERAAKGCSGPYASVAVWEASQAESKEDWLSNVSRCHALREEYMFQQCLSHTQGGRDLLLVCGVDHVDSLRGKFETVGKRVIAKSLFDYPWLDRKLWRIE